MRISDWSSDVCSSDLAYLRDDLKLAGFREPREVLMIGTEEESRDERVREFTGAWNRMNPRVQIRSYSAPLRQLAAKVADHARRPRARWPPKGRARRRGRPKTSGGRGGGPGAAEMVARAAAQSGGGAG